MDYLDPKKKKQKKARIMFMYALLGVAIAIATVVMVYLVNGYTVDRQTGEVVQNSLLYLDTKPESAEIYINGEKQRGRTDARLVLPAGSYKVEMKRDGYRTWNRDLLLEGAKLRRLTYARLIPEKIDTELGVGLASAPNMVTQSIDKRWLVHAFAESPLLMRVIDLERPVIQVIDIQLPLNLLTAPVGGVWEVIDWADDDKTFLARYTTATATEYVLINREDPSQSKNIQKLFPTTIFTHVELRARKNDQLYLFDKTSGDVFRGLVTNPNLELVQSNVVDFMPYEDDIFLFISTNNAAEGMVVANLQYGSETLKLREIKKSDAGYLLAISKLGNSLVMGVGSRAENRVAVYNDPVNALKKNDFSTLPVPTTVLKVENPQELLISADSSIIVAHGGKSFASHEFEADRSYNYSIDANLDEGSKLRWLDGQHLSFSIAGKQHIMDFDGSNHHEIFAGSASLGSFVDKDFDFLFSYLEPEVVGGPYRMMRAFLRTAVDR
jgi:PEGA domain